ncbi:MAG: histidinol dehydrogenase [Melioribacteraceae bacterium]|nr:MAG: histidinol dehydrogenase [Melioribacteraceae bacterium]
MRKFKLKSEEINPQFIAGLRGNTDYTNVMVTIKTILEDVKENGLTAVEKYARKFDRVATNYELKQISKDAIAAAVANSSGELKDAIIDAHKNIHKFHEMQKAVEYEVETVPGVICGRKSTPIESVGLYIPGGTAPLVSTLLMLAIPAKIEGCERIVMITPGNNGRIDDLLLFAADYCGIDEIYPVGGAHGIAMLAYGAKGITPVDKIFGPGNQYVTAAKMLISTDTEGCAIDMPAGPSEVLIIADDMANPAFVASDFLSQLEHGNDSQAVLITNSDKFISLFESELFKMYSKESRKGFIEKSLENSVVIKVENLNDAVKLSNIYAPEHLIINTKNEEELFDRIKNAGSVFIGGYSPESAGDYASGTNHSLPTSGYAKSYSGVSVEDFRKYITYQKLTKSGLEQIATTIQKIAAFEGLEAHANAIRIRLNES